MKLPYKKAATIAIAMLLALSVSGTCASAAQQGGSPGFYEISSPYAGVDWASAGQYKAANHTHSTYSDGSNFRGDMLKDKYAKDFDIVAITDHDVLTTSWDANPDPAAGNWNNIGQGNLSTAEMDAINNGAYDKSSPSPGTYGGSRTKGNGMIGLGGSNEITASNEMFNGGGSNFSGHHINAFFAGYSSDILPAGHRTMANILAKVEELGGVTHLNHPGRYTGGQNNAARSSDPEIIGMYVGLYMEYESCIGIEIINKWDGESVNDRILWDNILMQTMPQGRPVWGFSNDDSHSLSGNGHAWNVYLMPGLTGEDAKDAMEKGAFYGVSRIDRKHNINSAGTPGSPAQTTTNDTMYSGGGNNEMALGFLSQDPPPSIANIEVDGNTITIEGEGYSFINWIADGAVVATGETIDVSAHAGINSYVRAELVGSTGVAYTQPFGIKAAVASSAAPAASIDKLSGNQNRLTITVTENFSNGMENLVTVTIMISNNAAGVYDVGGYKVYVDTKGNDQIRACYIVE